MTKIFEALESAGLERYNLKKTGKIVIANQQGREITPAPYSTATITPPDRKGMSTVSSLFQGIVTLLPGKESRTLLFQGTQKGEGTSTMVRQLAKLAAMKLKKNVLLLDLNQKAPNQCSFFQVQSQLPPLDEALRVKLTRKDFARVDNSSLYVTQLPARGIPANIICEMPQIGPLLKGLKEEFELIIIDSPSAMSSAECLLLSPKVDGVVLVVQAEKTRWQTVDKVKERILAQDGNILGVVLNKRRYPIPNLIYKII
ncbi:MAG: CpsD/CapB family tyrosine-protein kinase [Desulfobacteraceae bacterium]|nr:CpsD/CapB family tyrosine-protein kinase [Desulfobacteraceae bacterium]